MPCFAGSLTNLGSLGKIRPMDTIDIILSGFRNPMHNSRKAIMISPAAYGRLSHLLSIEPLKGVSASGFIERACEVAETAIAQRRAEPAPVRPAKARLTDPQSKIWEVWTGRWSATGESGQPVLVGSAYAVTFSEACDVVCQELDPKLWGAYDGTNLSLWHIPLHPTEEDARAS